MTMTTTKIAPKLTGYQLTIQKILIRMERTDVPPRVVEASMRLMYGTLDHLPMAMFVEETAIGVEIWDQDHASAIEMAESFGL